MARIIKFDSGSAYVEVTPNGKKCLCVVAELYEGTTLLHKRVIKGFKTEAERDERANAAFAGYAEPEEDPVYDSKWTAEIGVSAAEMDMEPK